jgi:cyclopropane fatty-acyl-phospholipid synthase-like methyltransferase
MTAKMARSNICPWWLAYTFDNRVRRIFQKPEAILGPYVKEGMTVLDLGCGMGYFTIALAKLVGAKGRVIAADLQEKMLEIMKRRAQSQGLLDRIQPVLAQPGDIGVTEKVDFILAMWMVHEVPSKNKEQFLGQLKSCLKDGGKFLAVEPKMHVQKHQFQAFLELAGRVGFKKIEQPKVGLSRAVVLQKSA